MSQFIRSPMAALAFGASRLTPTPPSGRGVGTTRTTTCSTRRFSFPSGTRGCVVFASADDTHPSRKNEKPETNSVGNKGFVKGSGVLTMDQLLEVPIKRFKPTSEECPFCRDAPVKENGSKCLGICRNPQNVPGPLIFPHEMQEVTDAVRLQINALRENDEPRSHHGVQVMWEFSVESGNMERSRYFGMSTFSRVLPARSRPGWSKKISEPKTVSGNENRLPTVQYPQSRYASLTPSHLLVFHDPQRS